jgi:tetrahydromethanopterin S-methyltransferase subunit G
MANVYKCINTCTWDGRYWEEGTLTRPLSSDIVPPKHFALVNDVKELEEVLEGIDEEEDCQTFSELTQRIMDAVNTGVGICAGDLKMKNFKQLQGIAKRKELPYEGIKSKDELIELIEKSELEIEN